MKKLLIGACLVVFAMIAAIGVFLASLDLNEYKTEIIESLEALTGRKVEISGNIRFKVALTPTLEITGFRIGNPKWATDPYLLKSDQVFIKLAIKPILRGEVEFRKILLDGIRVHLESNTENEHTWQIFANGDSSNEGFSASWLNFKAVEISNVAIRYANPDSPPVEVKIKRLSLKQNDQARVDVAATFEFRTEAFSIDGVSSPLSALIANQDFTFSFKLAHPMHQATAGGKLTSPLENAQLEAQINASSENLATLLALFKIDSSIAAPLVVSANLQGNLRSLTIDKLLLKSGDSELSGRIEIDTANSPPTIAFDLTGGLIDLNPFLADDNDLDHGKTKRFFPDEPLPLALFSTAVLNGAISIDTLKLSTLTAQHVKSHINSDGAIIGVHDTNAEVAGGRLSVAASINLTAIDDPALELSLNAKDLELSQLPRGRDTNLAKGGVMNLNIKVNGRGQSAAKLMSESNGWLNIDIANAKLDNTTAAIATGDLLLNLLNGLNPLSGERSTKIECAAIRLPIRNGVAANDSGIAIRTTELNILGGGRIEFASEKIAFKAQPKPRKGIGVNVASLVDFVGIGGTLSEPRPTTDTKGLATAGVKVGAAIATGGLSLLAEGLFDRASSDVDVCAVARGDAKIKATETPDQNKAKPNVLESTGNKIKGVFKGLFGE